MFSVRRPIEVVVLNCWVTETKEARWAFLHQYPEAVDMRFVERFAERDSFDKHVALASSEMYAPANVAARVAPEPQYVQRILNGIRAIACKLAQPGLVPVNIPSVGLAQTTGVVSHCLWGDSASAIGSSPKPRPAQGSDAGAPSCPAPALSKCS